jgi:hypothetical protein
LVVKLEGRRPLERPWHRCEDMKMDLKEMGWHGAEWIYLAQDRDQWQAFLNMVMNLQVT